MFGSICRNLKSLEAADKEIEAAILRDNQYIAEVNARLVRSICGLAADVGDLFAKVASQREQLIGLENRVIAIEVQQKAIDHEK